MTVSNAPSSARQASDAMRGRSWRSITFIRRRSAVRTRRPIRDSSARPTTASPPNGSLVAIAFTERFASRAQRAARSRLEENETVRGASLFNKASCAVTRSRSLRHSVLLEHASPIGAAVASRRMWRERWCERSGQSVSPKRHARVRIDAAASAWLCVRPFGESTARDDSKLTQPPSTRCTCHRRLAQRIHRRAVLQPDGNDALRRPRRTRWRCRSRSPHRAVRR